MSAGAVKAARQAYGLTQGQAARLIGYSLRAWQSWEGGKRTMRPRLLQFFRSEAARKDLTSLKKMVIR